MKKIIALFLVLAMVLTCFVACATDDKDDKDEKEDKKTIAEDDKDDDKDNDDDDEINVVGTYSTTLDISEFLEMSKQSKLDISNVPAEYFELFADVSVERQVTLELNKDKTFEMTFSFDVDDFADAMIDMTIRYRAESEGVTEDDALAELIEPFNSKEALREYFVTYVETINGAIPAYVGTYEVNGNSVFLTDENSGESGEWTISGKNLTRSEDGITITLKRK